MEIDYFLGGHNTTCIGVAGSGVWAVIWCACNDAKGPGARSSCIKAMASVTKRKSCSCSYYFGRPLTCQGQALSVEDVDTAMAEILVMAGLSITMILEIINKPAVISARSVEEDGTDDYILQDMSV